MKTDRYRNPHNSLEALFVPSGASISSLPQEVRSRWAGAALDKTTTLDKNVPRVGLNVSEAMDEIESNGFYEAKAEFKIKGD
jgi:hypothetical protein